MTQHKNGIPNVFDQWNQISLRIQSATDIRLFLDFDGTLVSYRPRPEDVILSSGMKGILARLARHRRVHMAIVSGRRNAVLRQFVRIPHVQFMGLYGSEYHKTLHISRKAKQSLRAVRAALASVPSDFPGARVEEKGVSFAVHYWGVAPAERREVLKRIRRSLTKNRADFRVIHGDHSSEIVPRLVQGKGVAVRAYMKNLRSPTLPIYIGDDLADEPAFNALRRGITIRVGNTNSTTAGFKVKDHLEVRTFLKRLEGELS